MNLYDLLNVIGEAKESFVLEAIESRDRKSTKRISMRRPLLIAAIVAIMLLLVGCAVMYVLRLQDMSVGKETYTQTFDDSGKAIEPVEKEWDVLTPFGHSGDPIQLATKEWSDFLETYDPDGALMDNNLDHPEIPNQYEYTYSCYTQEMVEMVDEIAQKYDLKLLGELITFQEWQSEIFLEESGIGSLILPDSGAEMIGLSGLLYPPHNLRMEIGVKLKEIDTKLWAKVLYARKDYFPVNTLWGMDLSLLQQWNYTTRDGTVLLLALDHKGNCYIIADLSEAVMVLLVDGNFSGSAYPTAEEIMTKEQLEMVADVFDYSIQPQILDREAVMEKLAESDAVYNEQMTYVPETYANFSEALKSRYVTPKNTTQYAFFDLTGDGVEELLLGSSIDGAIYDWYVEQNGEIQEFWEIGFYLCEGQVIEQSSAYSNREEHFYRKAESHSDWVNRDGGPQEGWIAALVQVDGKWTYATTPESTDYKEITQEEAQAIMAQYPRISLDWKPLKDYPLSESQTMQDYWNEKDVRVSEEELLDIYKTYLQETDSEYYSHYRILDINGDGVDDLLLKRENDSFLGNTDFYWLALTYRYGVVTDFATSFYLCENGVLEHVETQNWGVGIEKNGHEFLRCDGLETDVLDFIVYIKSDASWYRDWWGEIPISEEEANAILAKYPRIDQGMRPISELYNE